MPTYTYFCTANQKTVLAFHPIAKRIRTWGELCRHVGVAEGDTPAQARVQRQIGSGILLRAGRGHAAGGCCGDAGCG